MNGGEDMDTNGSMMTMIFLLLKLKKGTVRIPVTFRLIHSSC